MKNYFKIIWEKLVKCCVTDRIKRRSSSGTLKRVDSKKESFIGCVTFADDVFTINKRWFRDFAKVYRERVNIPYHVNVRFDNLNEEIADLLKESNCFRCNVGIEAGALGGKLLGAGGGGFFLFYVPYFRQKNFVNYFRKLINVPFKFSSEGSKIMFKNIDKKIN